MSISAEKIAYLRGLADGLKLNEETNEGKLFLAIVDAIAAVSSEKDLLETRIDKMGDYMDEMDELIGQIADDVYEEDDGYFEDEDDVSGDEDPYDYDEDDDAGEIEFDDEEDDEEDSGEGDNFISTICPHCGAYVAITGDVSELDEPVLCPTCGKPLFPEEK